MPNTAEAILRDKQDGLSPLPQLRDDSKTKKLRLFEVRYCKLVDFERGVLSNDYVFQAVFATK